MKKRKLNQQILARLEKKYLLGGALFLAAVVFVFIQNAKNSRILFLRNLQEFFADPLEIKERMEKNDENLLVVDIREKEKYSQGYIQGAVNIPLSRKNFVKEIKILAEEKQVVLYGDFGLSQEVIGAAISLRKKGIRAKILPIGWREWQLYFLRNYDPAHLGIFGEPPAGVPAPGFAN